jgi:hypothetical protein
MSRRLLEVAVTIAWLAAACSNGSSDSSPSPSVSTSQLPPQQGQFSMNFDAGSATVEMSGYACTGLTGQWKVSVSVSGGGSGSGTTSFTPKPGDKGVPVTWSFSGQLDGKSGTWAGAVKVYNAGTQDAPRFQIGGTESFQTGPDTSTGPAAGSAAVQTGTVSACGA